MQISWNWLLLSWGPGLAHFLQCLLVQLEHLHAPPECWVSANWRNEAVSLWGWAVLNKQEQRGTVLHRASCGSILAPSAAVFTTPLAGTGTEVTSTGDNSNSIYMKAGQSASIQLPDVFFSAKPSQHDILHRICSDKNYYCVVYKIKAPVFSRCHNLKKQGSNALFTLVFMYLKFPSWRSTSFGQIQAKHQVLLILGRKRKRAKNQFSECFAVTELSNFSKLKIWMRKVVKVVKKPKICHN